MAIKMRPISEKDYKLSFGEVLNETGKMSNMKLSTTSKEIFTDMGRHSAYKHYESEYSRTGTIRLSMPVCNPFLGGVTGVVWSKFFKAPEGFSMPDIVSGRVVYDRIDDQWINANAGATICYRSDRHLIGAKIIQYMLDNYDVDEAIKNTLVTDYIYSKLTKDEKLVFKTTGEYPGEIIYDDCKPIVYQNDGFYFLIDNYFYHNDSEKFRDKWFASNEDLDVVDLSNVEDSLDADEEDEDSIAAPFDDWDSTMTKHMSPLSLLIAYRDRPDNLRNQIMDYVFLLPYGFRPTIDGRIDPLTIEYDNLVRINDELRNIISFNGSLLSVIMEAYQRLYQKICDIFVSPSNYCLKANKNFVSLSDSLSKKEGSIRAHMQSTRADFTGRSVITCNPYMSLDEVGIPVDMIDKLAELDIIQEIKPADRVQIMKDEFRDKRREIGKKVIDGAYIGLNRQPTLHRLSIQGFKARPVEGNALQLNPLMVMPFNADFDGDQMAVYMPVSQEAKDEVRLLMANTKNLFYPKNGEISPVPRHGILYGCWICSRVTSGTSPSREITSLPVEGTKSMPERIYNSVIKQDAAVYDTYHGKTCGMIALEYALQPYLKYTIGVLPLVPYGQEEPKPISGKWFTAYLQDCAENVSSDIFVSIINKIVALGFGVAEIWPPSISVTNEVNISDAVSKFNKVIHEREVLFNKGFETVADFTSFFDVEYDKLVKEVDSILEKSIPIENGYMAMVKSGAKGSMSNIQQLFGMKGRMMKDSTRSFNSIISNSLASQLYGLEHYVTAYGSRQGIQDKVIETSKPGYITRLLGYTGAPIHITEKDCGARNGYLNLTYKDFYPFLGPEERSDDLLLNLKATRKSAISIINGRWVVDPETGEEVFIRDKKMAKKIYDKHISEVMNSRNENSWTGINMRSPITCSNPCCAKCFGRDLTTMTDSPRVGMPVGFIAAQAIGEPTTQLTMKKFQGGGIAGQSYLTDSFDKVQKYFQMSSLKPKGAGMPVMYDPISPVSGDIVELSMGNGTKEILVVDRNSKSPDKNKLRRRVFMYEGVKVKKHVQKGESMCLIQGDLDMNEVLKYNGLEAAQKYLLMQLWHIFNPKTDVNSKYFEIIISAMTVDVVVKPAPSSYKTKRRYHTGEFMEHNVDKINKAGVATIPTLKGIKQITKFRSGILSTILMEDIGKGIRRAILTNPYDDMSNPITRTTFGLNLGIGSDTPGYLEE